MIDLKDFFTDKPLNSVSHVTLLKRLDNLEIKYCKNCNERLKFNSSNWNTSTYCPVCAGKIRVLNMKNTINKKYWVENISQLKNIQEKIKENNLEKYWVTNTAKLQSSKDKIKETNMKKYWVSSTSSLSFVKDKIKKTNMEKYWKESFLQTEKAREIRREKNNQTILDKNTNISKYRNWYKYKCDICWKTSYYWKDSKTTFLQRLRLWFIPCNHCLPINWAWINSRSSIEIKLEEELKKIWIKTEHKTNIDIFLPDYNLWIEINWIYWHSDKFKDKDYHKNKILKNKWIQLLFFTDYDLIHNYDRVLNYIKWKIWLLPSIWASKCKIKEINTKEAKNFCEKYHIHWFASWSKYYWLFFREELVSVCITWKNRFKKDNSIEIVRLCNKCKIIWWFARFLKIIKKEIPDNVKITTFIDSYLWDPENNIFTKNWFKYLWHTNPNYNWFTNRWTIKLSRQQCMKHKLLKKWYIWDTEDEIMRWLWWIKVYDWWNYKFEL